MSEREFEKLLSQIERMTWPENVEKSDEALVSDIGNHLLKFFGYDNGCLIIFSRDHEKRYNSYFGHDESKLRECEADITKLMKETGDKPLFSDEDTILQWQGDKYKVHDYISIPVHPTPDYTGVFALMNFCAKEKSQENAEYFQIRNYVVLYCIASLFTDRMVARHLQATVKRLQSAIAEAQNICCSPKMKTVMEEADQVARTDLKILILGESGVGKEVVARYIHATSGRKGQFIPVHCAALPESLVESELFGHEKGAFTGAVTRKIGRVELANEGTLFLDEIGDIPLSTQVKLLRVIQEGEFERVGGTQIIKVDFRLITATNKDLEKMMEEERFREDLYYRIAEDSIKIPPLRERREDILPLIEFFRKKYGEEKNKPYIQFSPETICLLDSYNWPGNVRQLENQIKRLVLKSRDDVIYPDALPDKIKSNKQSPQKTNDTNKLDTDNRREKLLEYVRKNGRITNREYRSLFGKSDQTMRNDVKLLVEKGLLVRQGQGRGVYYELARGDSRTTDK